MKRTIRSAQRAHSTLARRSSIRAISVPITSRRMYHVVAMTGVVVGSGIVVQEKNKVVACNGADHLTVCDELFDSRGKDGNLALMYTMLLKEYEMSPESKREVCYRLSRATYNLVDSGDSRDNEQFPNKKELRELCYKFALEALEVAPDDFRSAYWCGIGLSAVGQNEGTKKQIGDLPQMKEYFELAARLNPKDGTVQYCIGEWCYSLADLSWVKRKIAATLFNTPPESSFEEALKHFLLAEEAEPGFWNKNALMLAKTYMKLGNHLQNNL